MKIPMSVTVKIAELGRRALDEDDTRVGLAEEGGIWLRDKEPLFALTVLVDWIRTRTTSWIYKQTRGAMGSDEATGEQLPIPFPELPTLLEVGIGRAAHQSVMTRKDWANTLAIYRNRVDSAETLWRAVERRWQEVEPLFTDDDMTTADAMARKAVAV